VSIAHICLVERGVGGIGQVSGRLTFGLQRKNAQVAAVLVDVVDGQDADGLLGRWGNLQRVSDVVGRQTVDPPECRSRTSMSAAVRAVDPAPELRME